MIIGTKLIFCRNLPSTNTYVTNLLRTDRPPEGTIVYTNHQSEGKGQKGNKWESEDGKNLLVSIILYPGKTDPAEQFIISMTISLGICDFIERYLPCGKIKWPNDIYVNDDKIAGILIEISIIDNKIDSCVAGIGLNINQVKFLSDAPNPVSLSALTGKIYDPDICLIQLAEDIDRRYSQLMSGRRDTIRKEYITLLYRYEIWSDFKDINGLFSGRIISVSPEGLLQVENRKGGVADYMFNELKFIP